MLRYSCQAVREALKAFNDDEDVRVFLLSHRAGATGEGQAPRDASAALCGAAGRVLAAG